MSSFTNTPKIKLDTNSISNSSFTSTSSEPIPVPVFNSTRQSLSNSISSSTTNQSTTTNNNNNNNNDNNNNNNEKTQIIISNLSKLDFINEITNEYENSFVDNLHKLITNELINLNKLKFLIKWTNLPSLNRIILNFKNSEISLIIKNLILINFLNLNEKPKNLNNLKISLVSPLTSSINDTTNNNNNLKSPTYKESELQRIENLKKLYSSSVSTEDIDNNKTLKLSIETVNNLLDYSEPEPELESPLYKNLESISNNSNTSLNSLNSFNSLNSLNSLNSKNSINSIVLLNAHDTNSKVSIIKSEQLIDTNNNDSSISTTNSSYKSPVISTTNYFS